MPVNKRKLRQIQDQVKAEQKKVESNPAYQYVNNSGLPFAQVIREYSLNQYNQVDNKIFTCMMELSIIEEQSTIRKRALLEMESGSITFKVPDGSRLCNMSEMMTLVRMCDSTIWSAKDKLEKTIEDMIKFVGIQAPGGNVMLTPQEHDAIATLVCRKASKYGLYLFASNRKMLIDNLQ